MYELMSESSEETTYIKVHEAWSKITATGTELFPLRVSKAVILIVRNPFDIAVSFSNHFGI